MQWLLDLIVIALLAATLFHAMRLERALGVLKRDRAALEQLVEGFNSSTREAQAGIERLRAAADGAGRALERQTQTALGLRDDLRFLVERGERFADRLDQQVRAARTALPEPGVARLATASLERASSEPLDEAGTARPRSQAERDLLAALRLAR